MIIILIITYIYNALNDALSAYGRQYSLNTYTYKIVYLQSC